MIALALIAATLALIATGVAVWPGSGHADTGIQAILFPATSTVAPGTDFDLLIQIPQAGHSFNAFDAIVGYDPAALTLVALSPASLQEGTLMTAACGSRFHRFRQGSDRDTISLSLLCNGVSVTGPGAIYRLRFHASTTPQVTTVRLLPGLRFYDAGIEVPNPTSGDATVGIGSAVGAPGPATPDRAWLQARPNPSGTRASMVVGTPSAGRWTLSIYDLQGRVVSRLADRWLDAGVRELDWDGRTAAGERVRAGIYFAVLEGPTSIVRVPLIRLH